MTNQDIIVEEGLRNVAEIVYLVDKLHRLADDLAGDELRITGSSEIPIAIIDLCNRQAFAYSCLFDSAKSRMKEPPPQRKLRLARVQAVQQRCGEADFPNLANKDVRNGLVHWDDYMLAAIMRGAADRRIMNVAISSGEGIGVDLEDCLLVLVYVRATDTVHVFDATLQLAALKAEAETILQCFGYEAQWPVDA